MKLVGGWLLARFRSIPAHLADRECVAGHRVFAPNVRVAALVEVHLECSIGIERPDGTKRVGPCADESSRAGCGSGRAGDHQHYQSASEKNSERVLQFHGRHAALRQRDPSSADRNEEIDCQRIRPGRTKTPWSRHRHKFRRGQHQTGGLEIGNGSSRLAVSA
jgi:hypothetical protein